MGLKDKFLSYRFGIRVSEVIGGKNIFTLEQHKTIKQIRASAFTFGAGRVIVADPFLSVIGDTLYLFYEEQKGMFGQGVIMMTCTKDLHLWSKPVLSIKQDFHLSYPFVFEHDGQIMMMPETEACSQIRIYRALQGVTGWEHVHTLLSGAKFADSSFLYHQGKYYLFTNETKCDEYYARLFVSDDLYSEYHEHPASPIKIGKDTARNAGSTFLWQGHIYRPVQGCSRIYGEKVAIYQITKLTPSEYHEELMSNNIVPVGQGFYSVGGHHFNVIEFNGRIIVASDAIQWSVNLEQLIVRCKDKIRCLKF